MRHLQRWWMLLVLLLPMAAQCEDYPPIEVRDAFVELHSSPGRGYPVFEIAERGEQLLILKRRTRWLKVRTQKGREGWVPMEQLTESLEAAHLASLQPQFMPAAAGKDAISS